MRKFRSLHVSVLVVATLAGGATMAHAANMIVMFRPEVVPAAKAAQYGIHPSQVFSNGFSGFAADLSSKQQEKLRSDPDVAMIRPDRVRVYTPDSVRHLTSGATPSLFSSTSVRSLSGSTPVERIAQVTTRAMRRVGILESPTAAVNGVGGNANVDVAVIDTGIQLDHPDLNVVGGVNCSSGVGWADVEGHGTMVAGIIGAKDNAFGVVGAAPGARLWSIRAFDENNEADDSSILCAINWITDHADVIDVANMSFAGPGQSDGDCGKEAGDVIHYALCQSIRSGVTYIAAAGNDAADVSSTVPASYPEVISVSGLVDSDGATGGLGPSDPCIGLADDTFAPFSNFGRSITIAASSVCVSTTYVNSDVAVDSGTSFASPAVAGAAALWLTSPSAKTVLAKKSRSDYPRLVRKALLDNRERTRMPGDPDRVSEGILNIRGI